MATSGADLQPIVPGHLRSSLHLRQEIPSAEGVRSFEGREPNDFNPPESPLLQSQYLQQVNMASIARPAMLQKTCLNVASKRAFSTKLSSSFPAINKSSSTVSRKVVRNAFAKDAPGAMRVAAFHASGRNSILPPLPRKYSCSVLSQWLANFNAEVIQGTGMLVHH